MEIGALDTLPELYRQLCPEIVDDRFAGEPRATCLDCPMVPEFDAVTRCCTYHPNVANFLAGRALARGGEGAERLRARIARGEGVTAWGIYPSPERNRKYVETVDGAFGRDASLLCPYFVGGEYSCGIWMDRPATCRTWFCKHEDGLAGATRWSRLERVLWEIENRVAFLLIELGDPPAGDAPPPAFEDFYAWCSERANGLTDDELAGIRVDSFSVARDELIEAATLVRRSMPDVLMPSVQEARRAGERVLVSGYSSFDAVDAPASVYAFLAALDGETPWREALSAASDITEATVRELYRVGALSSAD